MTEESPPKSTLRRVRLLLWLLVALAIAGSAALVLDRRGSTQVAQTAAAPSSFGGGFTLVGGDGKPFSSRALEGKPYVIYFGFTRCGDVCPTTLSRLVRLRRAVASDQAIRIVFVTVDPKNDGPEEVGQYSGLFNAPIIGLTGSEAQIAKVKKQYGIYAEAVPNAPMGKQMEHTATVLLFDSNGQLAGTISPSDSDAVATAKLHKLIT